MTLLSTILAQTEVNLVEGGTEFGLPTDLGIGDLISWAIQAVLVVAAIAFFFMLIFGGIRWILSGGDKANTEAARNQVTAAIIGLVIVFSAYIILNFVFGVFGIDVGGLDFGTVA